MIAKFLNFIRFYLLDILVILSFVFSIFSLFKSFHTQSQVNSLITQISVIQSDVSSLSENVIKRFDALQANIDFIAKYSEANYLYFYGDVDGRHARLNSTSKSSSKTTSKK